MSCWTTRFLRGVCTASYLGVYVKILLVDVNYKHSSTGKIVQSLAEMLVDDGHDAVVCYGRGARESSRLAIRISSVWEVFLHAALTRLTGLTGFFSYFSTLRLIKVIKRFSPDVVHLHELHGYYLNIGLLVNYLKDNAIPVVWTFHCEFMYTGKCGYSYDCNKWQVECCSCPQLKTYPASVYLDFTRYMHRHKKNIFVGFDILKIVTPSTWLLNRVRMSFLSDKKSVVIPNGIDVDTVFYPRDRDALRVARKVAGKKVVLSIAPDIFDPRKGGAWVLELASRFGDEFIFILVGAVGEIKLQIPSNVVVLGRTRDQNELAEYYSIADVFLLTSEKETFSLVTVESLACGTPVLGFDAGAPTEVAPSPYGRFVPYGNVDELELLLNGFFSGEVPFKSRVECREYAVQNYSNAAMYRSYFNAYSEIIASRKLSLRSE